MINFRKWFVPGRHNNYHPHLLRVSGMTLAVFSLLFVNLSYNLTSAHKAQVLGYATNISAGQIIALSNQHRANVGLGSLVTSGQLTQAAQAKAQDMFAKNYWSHYSPDGTGPWYFITSAGYDYATAGENLAKDFNTSDGVVNGWMNSAAHRDNILNSSYRDVGVAAVNGVLQGSETTVVVAMYGSPKAAPAPAPAAPAATPAPPKASAAPVPSTTASAPAEVAPAATGTGASTSDTTPAPPKDTKASNTTASETPEAAKAAAREIDLQSVSVREDRNWAQNSSLLIVSSLFLVSILKHTVVWRTQKRGWRHIWLRAHPLAQYGLLLVAICANLLSGAGVIK